MEGCFITKRGNEMIELGLHGIKKYLDATLVLKNISFQVFDGEKVGIVGVNGSGKSTILKLIAGIETLNRDDKGWVSLTGGSKVGYLEQIPNYPLTSKVSDILEIAFKEVNSIESSMRELESHMKQLEGLELEKALRHYSGLQQKYEVLGGYEREEKLSKVCKGLKLEDSFLGKDFSTLSGGEKTTVILGKILLENPEVLLLDEPTNHLDMESIEWLENYLKSYKGIVLIVSHDRYFLDNVVTKIIEIEDMECETYRGNYSDYVRQKEENILVQFEQFKEQQKKIKSMEKTIKDLRDWAMRADNNKFFRRAASLQIKLNKMERIEKPNSDKQNMKLNFNKTERSGNEVIKVKSLSKSFGDKVIFNGSELLINYGERAALVGPNGSGKTTLLKMLLKEENVDSGSAEFGANVKTVYLPQHISFGNEELTVLECFREDVSILEGKAREYLSEFMFFGSSVFKKVKQLSGGEKIRLKLSKLLYEEVNLLILDEPTNHLDIESIENLEAALDSFKGTIFFVSHDRYFINKICDRVIAIEDKSFKCYDGNYDYFLSKRNEAALQLIEEKNIKKEKHNKFRTIDESKLREKEISKIEEMITTLECEISELDDRMVSLSDDYIELNRLHVRQQELNGKLEELFEKWERCSKDNLNNTV